MKFLTKIGGGNEIAVLCTITFFFGRRPKFFYYVFAFSLDKGMNSILKGFFHQARPFMVDGGVGILACVKSFGDTSGHSSASATMSIFLVLDIFHGSEECLYNAFKQSQTN